MSIKVYNSFRLKKNSDLWPLLTDTKKTGQKNFLHKLQEIYFNQDAIKKAEPKDGSLTLWSKVCNIFDEVYS